MKSLFLSAFLASGFAHAASAATLSLGTIPSGYFGDTVAILHEATLVSFGTDLFFGGADSRASSFCAVTGTSCATDMQIDFVGVVRNLSFTLGGHNTGDDVTIAAFDARGALIGVTAPITRNGPVDLSGFGEIGRIFIDDRSTAFGYGYGDFRFEIVDTVPLPGSALMLGAALSALVLGRLRSS